MSGKLDLGAVLRQSVSNLGTNHREQIEYIDIGLLDADGRNFYELSGIEELAANIELFGLQQPLRIRPNPEAEGRFIIVSGHRRHAALTKLVEENREKFGSVACIREQVEGSAALQELRLIYANSDTRKMTSSDISKQAERVEALLYQLKEEGYDFPGRMRDHVAEACKVSKSKLARLKVIREKLAPVWQPVYEAGDLNESAAYALAQMDPEDQRQVAIQREKANGHLKFTHEGTVDNWNRRFQSIRKLKCPQGGDGCINLPGKADKLSAAMYCGCESRCCADCADLGHCKYSCPLLQEQAAKLKADAKAQKAQERRAKAEADAPKITAIQNYWNRFGEARNLADKTVKEAFEAMGRYYGSSYEGETIAKECLEFNFKADSQLPYGNYCLLSEVEKYVKVADLFGCSLDYLLCRTDVREVAKEAQPVAPVVEPSATVPAVSGWISPETPPADGARVIIKDFSGFVEDSAFMGGEPVDGCSVTRWKDVAGWMPYPDKEAPQPTGQLVISGWMLGGTTPSEPCDVVAVFDLGGSQTARVFAWWNGSEFQFKKDGAKIDRAPVKWMALPPEE